MTSQVDGMRKLADSLVSSAEVVVAAEKILHLEAVAAAGVRVADLAEMSAAVAQMHADTDEAITAMAAARVEQAAADVAARADAEAARLELAVAAAGVRVADLAEMSAAVAQMHADTDEAIAAFGTARTEGADLLRKAMQTIQNIRRGGAANPLAKKPSRVPREATAPAEPVAATAPAEPVAATAPAEPVAEVGVDTHRRPNPTEIFAFIANNPDGASLLDMEVHFGTPRIVLQRPVKQMLEVDHQIVRDDLSGKYFAI